MNWKEYENEIYEFFAKTYPDAEISHDSKVIGNYSKVKRQVDILITQYVAGNRILIAVDGKYFNKKIDVKCVESFIGMLEDLGAHKGLLISKEGFSEAALNRAYYGPSEVELDILSFEDLHQFQGHGALPYHGNNGALIPAPFGWVIDASSTSSYLASLYPQGSTLEIAMNKSEFMYINFWSRDLDGDTLDSLLDIQEKEFKENFVEPKITFLPTIKRDDARVLLRSVDVDVYPSSEYTGFIEFESFIFMCVLFSPENRSRQNIRKLENVLNLALPFKVSHEKS
jgi:hypothetical protein